jgi:hypothetical protein
MSARNRHGECVYCGRIGKLTRDHVPPRCLFPKMPHEQLITVKSCFECNTAASKDDQWFVSMLALREGSEVDQETISSVVRALARPEAAGFRTNILAGMRWVNVRTPAGLFVSLRLVSDVNLNRLARVPTPIVKALFSTKSGHRLPDSYTIHTFAASGLKGADAAFTAEMLRFIDPIINSQPVVAGKSFACWAAFYEEPADASVWVTWFYGRVAFVSLVGPIDENAPSG